MVPWILCPFVSPFPHGRPLVIPPRGVAPWRALQGCRRPADGARCGGAPVAGTLARRRRTDPVSAFSLPSLLFPLGLETGSAESSAASLAIDPVRFPQSSRGAAKARPSLVGPSVLWNSQKPEGALAKQIRKVCVGKAQGLRLPFQRRKPSTASSLRSAADFAYRRSALFQLGTFVASLHLTGFPPGPI